MSLQKENILNPSMRKRLSPKAILSSGEVKEQVTLSSSYLLFKLVSVFLVKFSKSHHCLGTVYQRKEPALSISSLLNSERFSDIRLYIEGCIIPAHRFVLGMRCKYFNEMFKESKAQILEITDVKFETFKGMYLLR